MSNSTKTVTERRRSIRIEPPGIMSMNVESAGNPIPNAEVLNLSTGGAALRTPKPLIPGERILFNVGGNHAPVTCSVIACEKQPDGWFHVRCKCILGGFDLDQAA